jgi:hypothetical protein
MLKHLGFIGNSFNCQDTLCPFTQTALQPAEKVHGWREENFDKQDFCAFLTWGMQWTSANEPQSPEEIEVSEIDNL